MNPTILKAADARTLVEQVRIDYSTMLYSEIVEAYLTEVNALIMLFAQSGLRGIKIAVRYSFDTAQMNNIMDTLNDNGFSVTRRITQDQYGLYLDFIHLSL